MGTLQVWQHYAPGNSHEQVAMLPGKAPNNVSTSGTSSTPFTLDNATIGIRVLPDTDGWMLLSTAGTASTSTTGIKMIANQSEYFGVPPGGGYQFTYITA